MKANITKNSTNANGKSNASNANGFYGILVGDVNAGTSNNYGKYGYFWTSSSYEAGGLNFRVMHRYLPYNDTGTFRAPIPNHYLLSVRCKQD